MEFDEDVPQLEMDGRNWSAWDESVITVINKAGLYSYVDGTISEPDRQLEAMAILILTIGLPDSIFGSMLYLETAHDYYKYLTNRFDKSTVQPLQERLRKIEGCRDAEPQVAARTRKTFDGACRKCGERGHKARECGKVRVESGSVEVEEKPTRSHRKPRRRTENPDPVKTPPEELPSTSLEGGRTQASDELNEVRNDEIETVQPTWMPHDEESGGEVHGVAKSHEEAARVDVEGGEVDEMSRTTNDGERQADTSTDKTTATTTANPPADANTPERPAHIPVEGGRDGRMATGDEPKGEEGTEVNQGGEAKTSTDKTTAATTANTSMDASAPSQSSVLPERREGQATTGNAGAGMHQPNRAQTGKPRR